MAAAKHRALDRLRRDALVARKHEQIAGEQAIEPFTVPDHRRRRSTTRSATTCCG